MNYHDPIRQSKYLRQTLSQNKKPLGFFISAGCPLAIRDSSGNPLIPDVAGLTKYIKDELEKDITVKPGKTRSPAEIYKGCLDEIKKTMSSEPNIEDILSFVRGLQQIAKGSTNVRGLSEAELDDIEMSICESIAKRLKVSLPHNKTPYHKLAKWINNIEREVPIEIFTTNYDLLAEEAFEALKIPYFDGFVGARFPFFDLRSVEDNLIPIHWTRLWKIHGSINWYMNEDKTVYRSTSLEGSDPYIIHPSHLKYEQSRKMPYLVLIDRLNKFLRQNSAVLVISGYSFNDDHLNDTILNALRANPTGMVIALLYGNLTSTQYENTPEGKSKAVVTCNYTKALELSESRSNLSVWTFDEAVIGGFRAKWKPNKMDYEPEENVANAVTFKEVPIKDIEGNDTTDLQRAYEFHLGDFAVFGDFMQELIGMEKSKINEDGK